MMLSRSSEIFCTDEWRRRQATSLVCAPAAHAAARRLSDAVTTRRVRLSLCSWQRRGARRRVRRRPDNNALFIHTWTGDRCIVLLPETAHSGEKWTLTACITDDGALLVLSSTYAVRVDVVALLACAADDRAVLDPLAFQCAVESVDRELVSAAQCRFVRVLFTLTDADPRSLASLGDRLYLSNSTNGLWSYCQDSPSCEPVALTPVSAISHATLVRMETRPLILVVGVDNDETTILSVIDVSGACVAQVTLLDQVVGDLPRVSQHSDDLFLLDGRQVLQFRLCFVEDTSANQPRWFGGSELARATDVDWWFWSRDGVCVEFVQAVRLADTPFEVNRLASCAATLFAVADAELHFYDLTDADEGRFVFEHVANADAEDYSDSALLACGSRVFMISNVLQNSDAIRQLALAALDNDLIDRTVLQRMIDANEDDIHDHRSALVAFDVDDMCRAIYRARWHTVRPRLFDIALALESLRLPVLVTLQIVDCAVDLADRVPMFVKWSLLALVKQ